jgi:hypothetical protein
VSDPTDARLAEAGQRWRDAQPAPPGPDVGRFADAVGVRTRWVPVVATVGIAVVLIAILVPLSLRRGPAGAPDPASPSAAGRPVPVEGIGTLLRDGDGPIRLCAQVVVSGDALPPAIAQCGLVAVVTTGVDGRTLTGATERGQRFSGPVRVEGTYRAGVLAVTRVVAAPPDNGPPEMPATVPCPSPPNGWRPGMGLIGSGHEVEAAKVRLIERVLSEPARFLEAWNGRPARVPGAPPSTVQVVGTTGDVAAAQAELSAIYPGNLCVHAVRFSASDLNRIVQQLSAISSTPIAAEADPIVGRVHVRVVALDPPTNAILDEVGRDALILEEPLLRWLE